MRKVVSITVYLVAAAFGAPDSGECTEISGILYGVAEITERGVWGVQPIVLLVF